MNGHKRKIIYWIHMATNEQLEGIYYFLKEYLNH